MPTKSFTPGPWDASKFINGDFRINYGDQGRWLGLVYFDGDVSDRSRSKANAHLIAAAPELYESLEDVLGLVTPEFEQCPMVAFAKAALAKARGEAV